MKIMVLFKMKIHWNQINQIQIIYLLFSKDLEDKITNRRTKDARRAILVNIANFKAIRFLKILKMK